MAAHDGPAVWDALVGGGRRARRARRPRHPQARGRPAALRPRARPRPGRTRDPHLQLPAGHVRGQLLTTQGPVHRPPRARETAASVCAHPAPRLLAARRPAAAHPAGGRDRPRHRPRGFACPRPRRWLPLRRRDLPRLGDERHRRPVLGPGRGGPLLAADRRAPAALDRAGLHRQPRPGGRRGRGRRARTARPGARRPLPPAERRPALRTRHHLGLRAAADRARGRRGGREGAPAPGQGHREPRVAPARVHRPHPQRDDGVAGGPHAQHHRSLGPLRRTQESRGLLRRRRLLLPGHQLHPRGGAAAGERVPRLPRLPRGRDAHGQRPDGQHRRLQRAGRLPQPRRPQGGAAADRQGRQQPHRQGRPPLRAAHGRAARLRRPRPAHRAPGGRRHPGAPREPVQGGPAGAPRRARAGAPRARHPRQEHGAAPRARVRGAPVPRRGRHPRRPDVRHGARARAGRKALPGAVRRGRRHRHRFDAQDVLRDPARHRRRALGRDPTRSTTSGRRSNAGPSPAP